MQEQRKPYSAEEIALTMNDVSKIIEQLSSEGFLVNKVVIGNALRPTIFLFSNDKCRDLIISGKASYQHFNNVMPIKQGVFEYSGCRVVWSESLI
ncbi:MULTISPECIES: hypothetical protein [unclassified Gilliamella]|uniref:hypothetical protein n=1 Tax=unclassified Gilliamella TaxID=2685620 RepID=UPI0011473520|nr:hypothetical protein [Gilliamella apicola]